MGPEPLAGSFRLCEPHREIKEAVLVWQRDAQVICVDGAEYRLHLATHLVPRHSFLLVKLVMVCRVSGGASAAWSLW